MIKKKKKKNGLWDLSLGWYIKGDLPNQVAVPLYNTNLFCILAGSCHPEGFVIRTTDGFPLSVFESHVAKYVREGHVQTDEAWRRTWKQAKLS